MLTKKYVIYFGTEKDRLGYTIDNRQIKLNTIVSQLFDQFAGFTWIDTKGYWEGQVEKSVKIELLGNVKQEQIDNVSLFIKKALDQDDVLVTLETIELNTI